jgi:hypothetical protein
MCCGYYGTRKTALKMELEAFLEVGAWTSLSSNIRNLNSVQSSVENIILLFCFICLRQKNEVNRISMSG